MSANEEKKSFGAYIRKKRLESGLTQKDLAGQLFVTESTVSKWERGLSYPDVSMVTAICAALRITEHEFFTACDDDQAHTQARQAAALRRLAAGTRCFFAAGYAIAVAVCFICDLAVFHALDWFWIVLTGVALAFCFTNLPFLVRRNRLPVCLGAASGCLLLLLLACWGYAGGWWIIGGLATTAACLALPWGWWAVWRFYGKNVPPLCVGLLTVWVFALLAVIWAFAGGDWLFPVAFPLAAAGGAFLWAGFAAVRWLPAGPWLKAGVIALLVSFAAPVFNCLCGLLLAEQIGPRFWDYFSVGSMLARQNVGELSWINILVFQLMLVCSLVAAAIGAAVEFRRRKRPSGA